MAAASHDKAEEAAEKKAQDAAEAKASEVADPGPWWVQDNETKHKFATYYKHDGVTVLDESPWVSGPDSTLRPAEPNIEGDKK